tara:strand:+ start:12246 stop:13172 length:927 start_codon:yes stop_codon:yes gene_type:complete
MKIKPEQLLNNNIIQFKKFFITGLDTLLIDYVTKNIVDTFKKENYFIDRSQKINSGLAGDLFSSKNVLYCIAENYPEKNLMKDLEDESKNIIISTPNNKKLSSIRSIFLKSKECLLVECYGLNRASKEFVLKSYVEKNNIKISNEVFWYIVDNFENKYVFFLKQLGLIKLYNGDVNLENIEKIVLIENNFDISRLIFSIFKKNNILVNLFNKNILSQNDLFYFFMYIKNYLKIVSLSKNKEDALSRFPKYLFKERDVFLKIYSEANESKIKSIYKGIQKAETLTRKNPGLFSMIGLRFLLNLKKIITS